MKRNLQNLRSGITKAVQQRRFLFDQLRVNSLKKQARKAALEKIGAAIFLNEETSSSSSRNRAKWRKEARRDEHHLFREDEKDDMDLYYDDDYEKDSDTESQFEGKHNGDDEYDDVSETSLDFEGKNRD